MCQKPYSILREANICKIIKKHYVYNVNIVSMKKKNKKKKKQQQQQQQITPPPPHNI